ncbi:hypothetical protein SH584_11300 [Sphingomonas sp. LY29]|uniref:hypothetical protein n=1 Tax=Sphingomonas sp. LY29 TaxID=3095341 RepID=UPI002D77F0C7|nr:hypothetical protein [Sphingomonas sp. LY29]WRP25617.1 hypothetical protein SH584_11300 [Sphingomonas sp. LY29]
MNAPNLGTENPMTDKEILVERVARTGKHLLDMIDAQRRDITPQPTRETNDDANSRDERDQVFGHALEDHRAAIEAIASMPHSEQVEEPDSRSAAQDVGRLATRMLELAKPAGLYVQIKIDPALTRNVSDKE